MSAPHIYQAIAAVAGDLAGVGLPKSMTNPEEGYEYRSIDGLMNRLSPILAARKMCILPRVLERTSTDRSAQNNEILISVTLKVAFDLVSCEDGSSHTIEVYGEALDRGDKATAKALTSAYKTAMLQTFCVPVLGSEDADASTFKLRQAAPHRTAAEQEPPEGWERWSADIKAVIHSCETEEAIARVQDSNRALLRSLAREQPQLYADLGTTFSIRRQQVRPPAATPLKPTQSASPRRKKAATSSRRSKANGAAAPIH
jgi:hypothetical protein